MTARRQIAAATTVVAAVLGVGAVELYADRIPQAIKVLLEDGGHMSLSEQPDAVAAAVTLLIERGHAR